MRVLVMLVTIALLTNVVQADEPSNARRPKNDAELRVWLENMIWQHRYTNDEITAATSLTADELKAARTTFDIRDDNRPARAANGPLFVLPYPGGRHPRIGFLDGAVNPQRETKVTLWLVISLSLFVLGVWLLVRSSPGLPREQTGLVLLLALSFEPFLMECW